MAPDDVSALLVAIQQRELSRFGDGYARFGRLLIGDVDALRLWHVYAFAVEQFADGQQLQARMLAPGRGIEPRARRLGAHRAGGIVQADQHTNVGALAADHMPQVAHVLDIGMPALDGEDHLARLVVALVEVEPPVYTRSAPFFTSMGRAPTSPSAHAGQTVTYGTLLRR